ncbi:DUF302 domain-containing protein [Amaricoccus tamworthensis]|uniref:DUF302 domain-containing protein n=1 Tax=Amaricoccus tamworthensis TaxID=57002 RepID=UPI003C7C574A
MKPVTAATIALLTATASPALADLITKTSPYSVDHTVNRLALAAEEAGATVFADVDHAAGAEQIGTRLSPTRMLMFGNPKIGTPAIEAAPTAGLDLPLRVVVYENADGSVSLSYHEPADLAATHGIDADAPYLATMNGALGKLTDAAIAEE